MQTVRNRLKLSPTPCTEPRDTMHEVTNVSDTTLRYLVVEMKYK